MAIDLMTLVLAKQLSASGSENTDAFSPYRPFPIESVQFNPSPYGGLVLYYVNFEKLEVGVEYYFYPKEMQDYPQASTHAIRIQFYCDDGTKKDVFMSTTPGSKLYKVLQTHGTKREIIGENTGYEVDYTDRSTATAVKVKTRSNAKWLAIGNNAEYIPDTEYSPATKKYVDDAVKDSTLNVSGATPGQIVKIAAVDEAGKPTAWEAVDMPSGGGSGGGEDSTSGWRKVTEYVWDVNKEYQPLTLNYATGEMTFDETPPFNKACWVVPNETNVHNTLYHSLYSKIPNEFLAAGKVAVFSQGTNGVLYDNKTNLAVDGVNQNVDVSAFRFEHANSNVVFDGLNAKRLLIKMSFIGGNINLSNGLWNFIPVFSDGSQANLVSTGVVSSRIMTGCLEQEMYIADGKFYCMQRIIGKMVKNRTNGNQGDTPIQGMNTAVDIRATKDTTITKIQYLFGNGNYLPANGTLVEVFEFAE